MYKLSFWQHTIFISLNFLKYLFFCARTPAGVFIARRMVIWQDTAI